jgi:hypothetical protein
MLQEVCVFNIAFVRNMCAIQVQEGHVVDSVKSGLLTAIMDMEESTVKDSITTVDASTNTANGVANSGGKAFAPQRPWHK